uniref:Uncharacterized protein n=1 Tax=Meloidogyne enterolobii TaxID=390850 RepID=A0A6V7U1C8_MELEN|nr:unnamed protein product [Meloidogyne enterolobii]
MPQVHIQQSIHKSKPDKYVQKNDKFSRNQFQAQLNVFVLLLLDMSP